MSMTAALHGETSFDLVEWVEQVHDSFPLEFLESRLVTLDRQRNKPIHTNLFPITGVRHHSGSAMDIERGEQSSVVL